MQHNQQPRHTTEKARQQMSDEFDYFELGSGLPLADAEVTITNAEFRFDTSYSADAVVCAMQFTPHEEGVEAQEQLYSVGKGWEPLDRGEMVGHGSGKQVKINNQSNYGRFIAAAVECEGFLDYAREVGLQPNSAALWVGTQWHLGTVEVTTTNPSKPNDPPKVKSVIVPDEFLGAGEEEEEEKAPAKKAPAKKVAAKKAAAPARKPAASPAADQVAELQAEDGGEELVEALIAAAGEAEDQDAFMEAAMEIDGVSGNRLAEKVVMNSKPGSIWAEHGGE